MEKTPIWLILNRLAQPETADLEKFAASPLHGGSPELQKLLSFLIKFLQKKTARTVVPSREDCYRAVFPTEKFRPEHFRQLLHRLTELARNFLIFKSLETNETVRNRLLAEHLEKLDLSFLAQNALQKAERKLENSARRDPAWHEERVQVRRQVFNAEQGGARTQNLKLQNFADDLERSFILQKLKLSCEQISHSAVFRTDYDFGLLDPVLEKISHSDDLLRQPEIAVYYHCCLALLHPDDSAHFEVLKPHLLKIGTIFPQQECRDILLLSLNYCIRKVNQGQNQFSHEGLELYKLALEQGFLFEKGEISRFTFRNVVAMGLKIGAFDWVENFIVSNRERLPAPHRESMVSFNLARLSYERGRFAEALDFLQKADHHDILLALAAKTLFLKIAYEMQELRLLDAAIDSFKIFLRRKKVLAYHRENYRNFLKFLERLVALNFSNLSEKNALRTAILAEETLTEREWFLAKM